MLGIQLKSSDKDKGYVIAHPWSGSTAAAAGLQDGDEILGIDATKVENTKSLMQLLNTRAAGQKVQVHLRRDGKERKIGITLAPATEPTDEVPANPVAPAPAPGTLQLPGTFQLQKVVADQVYVADKDGVVRLLTVGPAVQVAEKLRTEVQGGAMVPYGPPPAGPLTLRNVEVTVPEIRVERSDAEKRIAQVGRDVQSLQKQVEKLTEEIQRLQKQFSERTPRR